MDLYKPICKNIIVPLWAKWERSPYLKHVNYLMESQYYSIEKIREIQLQKVKQIIGHAYSNCEYYNRTYKKAGIHPSDIKTFEDFLSVPILDKDTVKNSVQALIAPNVKKYTKMLTSGSTGKPLIAWRDKECQEFKRACGIRSGLWSGWDFGERIYWLYGSPEKEFKGLKKARSLFRRKFLNRTELLDLLNLNEFSMLNFANKMIKKPPSLIWGHAHALCTFARFLEKHNIDSIRPKGIYSAGMVLHDHEREIVEKIFKTPFQDRYGCEELGLIACECKREEGLHINTDALYVEFLDKYGVPVHPGEQGHVVITDLTNMAMPFIRYKIEDIGTPSKKQCSCGRSQPLIEKIEGRVADFLIKPNGDLVSGISLTDHFAGHIPGVVQIQIIQEKMDFIRLNIVKNNKFDINSKKIVDTLVSDFFSNKMNYEFNFVKNIPVGLTGKFRFTICNIKHELL